MALDELIADGGANDAPDDAVKANAAVDAAADDAAGGADAAAEAAADEAGGEDAPDGAAAKKKRREPMDVSRRTLLIGAGGTAALLGLGALRYVGHNPLVRPPGGQDESHLVSACIRCEKCYEACPRGVIVPAHIEDGLLGMRSPMLDFENNHCDFCQEEDDGKPLCVKTCPTLALSLPEDATPENTILGLAVIDERTCLAYRDTGCRYCYDACPYEAIELTSEGANPRPVIIGDKCNGCGACESVCVSLKAGSIATGATERAVVIRPLDSLE